MRDRDFDFYWSDKYSENLLARGFAANHGPYGVAVAFEVLEHLPNPIEFLRESKQPFEFR
jgi:2-polyprenyl-3-methyl-5-hydroxy-6-metoxy-1,4-benzoquinol methylase